MIKFIVEEISSKMDRNGNTYYAFLVTETSSDKTVMGKVGPAGRGAALYMVKQVTGVGGDAIYFTTHELPIREFNSWAKSYPYLATERELYHAMRLEGMRIPPVRMYDLGR